MLASGESIVEDEYTYLMSFEVLLAAPRGFCAGVERAIRTVELALENRAPGDQQPVYVRHEIVHNKVVVEDLRARGAVLVEELAEIPVGATAVFSAHGVAPSVREEAVARDLVTLDATCPLVSRVHAAVLRYASRGYEILFVGHAGHPEVEGVMGESPDKVQLIQTIADADSVQVQDPAKVAFATQTTLSVEDVSGIVQRLRTRFPKIVGPEAGDMCYATTNRQEAVRALVEQHAADVILVLGSPNSSNSNRLREVAEQSGARAYLLGRADELEPGWLEGARRVGVTAGASTPEKLVQDLVERLKSLGASTVETVQTRVEDVFFAPPPIRR
jgi:4-hydroxy-3-methylbut-2-en-1-yl diphosphate reductase